jgi:hypothetical protein
MTPIFCVHLMHFGRVTRIHSISINIAGVGENTRKKPRGKVINKQLHNVYVTSSSFHMWGRISCVACMEEMRNSYNISAENLKWLWNPRGRWEDNFKINFKQTESDVRGIVWVGTEFANVNVVMWTSVFIKGRQFLEDMGTGVSQAEWGPGVLSEDRDFLYYVYFKFGCSFLLIFSIIVNGNL